MYVAVRDSQLRHARDKSNPIEAMKSVGVSSVELMVNPEMKTPSFKANDGAAFDLVKDIDALVDVCKSSDISVCGILMGNRFDQDDAAEVDWLVKTIEAARKLATPAVRVDVVARGMEAGPFMKKAAGILREALKQTESTGMTLGVENHGTTSNRVEFLRELFDAVGSDRFGLTLDTGNFYWYGYPLDQVYEIMAEVAPSVKHTHVKNIKYPEEKRQQTREPGWEYGKYVSPVPDGDIDHKRVADILKAAGYTGALTLEDESYGHFDEAMQSANLLRNVEHLKSVV